MYWGSKAIIETLKSIDHPIKYATDNINEPGFKCEHCNIKSY